MFEIAINVSNLVKGPSDNVDLFKFVFLLLLKDLWPSHVFVGANQMLHDGCLGVPQFTIKKELDATSQHLNNLFIKLVVFFWMLIEQLITSQFVNILIF